MSPLGNRYQVASRKAPESGSETRLLEKQCLLMNLVNILSVQEFQLRWHPGLSNSPMNLRLEKGSLICDQD